MFIYLSHASGLSGCLIGCSRDSVLTPSTQTTAVRLSFVWTTTRAVMSDLDAHTTCEYPVSPVPIPGVCIEVVYGTHGCPGVMDTCDYRSEPIYGSTTGMYDIIERHEVNLRRVGSHSRDNPRYSSYRFVLICLLLPGIRAVYYSATRCSSLCALVVVATAESQAPMQSFHCHNDTSCQ